jgi:hypothetical protein
MNDTFNAPVRQIEEIPSPLGAVHSWGVSMLCQRGSSGSQPVGLAGGRVFGTLADCLDWCAPRAQKLADWRQYRA